MMSKIKSILNGWANIDSIRYNINHLDKLNYEELCDLEKELLAMEMEMSKQINIIGLLPPTFSEITRSNVVRIRKVEIEISRFPDAKDFYVNGRLIPPNVPIPPLPGRTHL